MALTVALDISTREIPQNAPWVVTATTATTLGRLNLRDASASTITQLASWSMMSAGQTETGVLSNSLISTLTVGHNYQYIASASTGGEVPVSIGYYTGGTTITFDDNGGTGGPGTKTVYWALNSGMTQFGIVIPSATPTRAGYTFLGWAPSSSATAAQYTAGQDTTIAVSTLYAVWQRNPLFKVKIGNSWKDATDTFVKIGSTWKQITDIKIKVGSAWKDIV